MFDELAWNAKVRFYAPRLPRALGNGPQLAPIVRRRHGTQCHGRTEVDPTSEEA